ENLVILVLFSFLQRVLNGGADIKREYALGRLRVDICITYKERHYPLEVKIKGHKTEAININQLLGYMDRCGSAEGWLVVCDKDLNLPWKDKLTWETKTVGAQTIHVVGC
ncbi:MAG: ATP-binding protein, partial [Deltaproteobacteria bacterium]|nr:ATP-binding protein [Deltaproteobacteria bacterium]